MDKTKNNSITGKLLTLYAQIWLYQLIGIVIFAFSLIIGSSGNCSGESAIIL